MRQLGLALAGGVTVHASEVDMFEGLASRDKDPRKSLHLDEVATPELGPGEAVYIDKDVVHGSYTLGDEPAKLTVILTPTAGEGGYEVIDVFEEEPWASLR